MLSYLYDYDRVFGPLRILRYITLRTILAAGTAALIGFIIGPWMISHLRRMKFGQHYDDDRTGDLAGRFDKKNTPTMGGLLIFACVFGSSILWAAPNVWVVVALFVYTALTAVGFRDDYLKVVRKNRNGISSGAKIFWQTITTALALLVLLMHPASSEKIRELWVPFVKHPLIASMPIAALAVFVYLWIVGFSNAINLTDGLDGLAIGCTITVALTYGIMAYAAGNSKIADYLLISFVPGTGELTVVCGAPRGRRGRVSLVQLPSRRALHGRHGVPGHWRPARHHRLHGPAAPDPRDRRRRLRMGGGLGRDPGGVLQVHAPHHGTGQALLPDGAHPPPFPEAGMAGDEGRPALLDPVAHLRPGRA